MGMRYRRKDLDESPGQEGLKERKHCGWRALGELGREKAQTLQARRRQETEGGGMHCSAVRTCAGRW